MAKGKLQTSAGALHEALAGATAESIARLRDIIKTGPHGDAIAAAKVILARTLPEPKVNTAAAAAQGAALGAANASVGGQLSAVLNRAEQRRLVTAVDMQTATDATFAPLPRVQTSE